MTNGWIDIKNTDMMLIMGGNPAENHPCGFKWAVEAKLHRNAKTIVVDPRFTRTATQADLFLQIRAGTDIAFLGGLINYAIQNNRLAKDYLINYTNAAFVVKEGFKLPEDGLFSGFDGQTYNKETWNYEAGGNLGPVTQQTTAGSSSTTTGQATREEPAQNFERRSEPVSSQPSTPQQGGQGWARDIRQLVDRARRDKVDQSPHRCSRQTSRTIFRCNIRVLYSSCLSNSIRATHLKWSSASPAFREISF